MESVCLLSYAFRKGASGTVLFSAYKGGKQVAKVTGPYPPVGRGNRYAMLIEVAKIGYYITINGARYSVFKHKIALKLLTGYRFNGLGKAARARWFRHFRSGVMSLRSITLKKKYAFKGKIRLQDFMVVTGQSPSTRKNWTMNFWAGKHVSL